MENTVFSEPFTPYVYRLQKGDVAEILDKTLIDMGGVGWKVRQAVEGVQIFGGIGSGKTSGSGRMLALKYLSAGFGGLVLTAKPEEKLLWQEYCQLTNRTEDLIIIAPSNKNYFNFLEYETTSNSWHISATTNIVQVLKTVIRASEEKATGKTDDPFWETALDMLMANIIDLCLLAYGRTSVKMLYEVAQSLPKKKEEEFDRRRDNEGNDKKEPINSPFFHAVVAAKKKVKALTIEWARELPSDVFDEISQDEDNYEAAICDAIPEARALRLFNQFIGSFYSIGEKTRSIIDFSFSGFLYGLLRDPIYSIFCKNPSNVFPDDCRKGKIILLDLPVKDYHKVGRDSQILFKYIWQRAMERGKDKSLPVFLWADEAQNFLHEYDPDYQATARSSNIATVYISQNLPNYHANMGGAKSEFKVKSFLGTLATKIFHANADVETNRYASELIGEIFYEEESNSMGIAGQPSSSRTKSQKLDKAVRPEQFARLKTGGPDNEFKVMGYVHLQGNILKNGANFLCIQFDQKYSPHKSKSI